MHTVQSFSFAVRLNAEMNNTMSASQRIYQYTKLEIEDELVKRNDKEVVKSTASGSWPPKGEVVFDNVTMRYRENMEPSLRGLSFKV